MKVTETIVKEFKPDRIAITKLIDGKFEVGFFEEKDFVSFSDERFYQQHKEEFGNLLDACNYLNSHLKELEK